MATDVNITFFPYFTKIYLCSHEKIASSQKIFVVENIKRQVFGNRRQQLLVGRIRLLLKILRENCGKEKCNIFHGEGKMPRKR